jgi:cystathionine beta-lyase
LGVRLDRHVENAAKIADYLLNHAAVKKVYYPGHKDFPGYEINQRQAKNGGAMLSFELKESYDIRKFYDGLELVALAESLGGVESLVCHPASMTHASIPYEIRQKVGITEGLIRLSVGIENVDEIIKDLETAIQAANA